MDKDYLYEFALKVHGLRGMSYSDSESDEGSTEGIPIEDLEAFAPPPIDISKCVVYTVSNTNQPTVTNGVIENPWQTVSKNPNVEHQNSRGNDHEINKQVNRHKNTTPTKKPPGNSSINRSQLEGCLQLSEKSSEIYNILREHQPEQLPDTLPIPVALEDLVRALVVAFLFDIDVQQSTIDIFHIKTDVDVLEHSFNAHFRSMMTQINISPDNPTFLEYYQKLDRLLLHKYKKNVQTNLNGDLDEAANPINIAPIVFGQQQDVDNKIPVSQNFLDNVSILESVLQLTPSAAHVYFAIKSDNLKTKKQCLIPPLISKKIQSDLERSFLQSLHFNSNSAVGKSPIVDATYTKIKDLIRALTVSLLFGFDVKKSLVAHYKSQILKIDMLKKKTRKHLLEIMTPLKILPESPIFVKFNTILEDFIIEAHTLPIIECTKQNIPQSQKGTGSKVGTVSLRRRFKDIQYLANVLSLTKTEVQLYLIIRASNKPLPKKDHIFSLISEGNRKLVEKQYCKIMGGKSSPVITVKVNHLVKAIIVALLFEIDVKNPFVHKLEYRDQPRVLAELLTNHFENMMARLSIVQTDQIFGVLYKKINELLLPDLNFVHRFDYLPVQVNTQSKSGYTSYSYDKDFPVLAHTDVNPSENSDDIYMIKAITDAHLSDYASNNGHVMKTKDNYQEILPESVLAVANKDVHGTEAKPKEKKKRSPKKIKELEYQQKNLLSENANHSDLMIQAISDAKLIESSCHNSHMTKVEGLSQELLPDAGLTVASNNILHGTGAIPKEKKMRIPRKRKENKDQQACLLDAITICTNTEEKSSLDTEKVVLPVDKVCETNESVYEDCSPKGSAKTCETFTHNPNVQTPINLNVQNHKNETEENNERLESSCFTTGVVDCNVSSTNLDDIKPATDVLETHVIPANVETHNSLLTQNENISKNTENNKHDENSTYNLSNTSVNKAHIRSSVDDQITNHSASYTDAQAYFTYFQNILPIHQEPRQINTSTVDNTSDLNTINNAHLPLLTYENEYLQLSMDTIQPHDNMELISPLHRLRYVLILYYAFVLGSSFLEWTMENSFSILIMILLVFIIRGDKNNL